MFKIILRKKKTVIIWDKLSLAVSNAKVFPVTPKRRTDYSNI